MVLYYTGTDGLWHARGRAPIPPLGDPGFVPGWGFPVWRDEFDGDLSAWTVRDEDSLSYDWARIRAANATVIDHDDATGAGKALRLRLSDRVTPHNSGGRLRHWDSAYLDTIGKFSQVYGRWEMRAKIPTVPGISQGVWPAFWLRNTSVGEIDIMESWGGPTKNRARNVNLDGTSTATGHESTNGGAESYGQTYEHRLNAGSGGSAAWTTPLDFHTWAVEYTPTYLRFYQDGVMTEDIRPDGDRHPAAGANAHRDFSWVFGPTFTTPWSIRLNIQMGDPYWSSDTDPATGALSATMPADFLIDYVRCYALPD